MKKREPKVEATNNIILDDEEMEVLIRQLVKKANEKGACMSVLNKAVTIIWKEEFQVEKQQTQVTAKEKEFFHKVEKFLNHYGDALVALHDERLEDKRFVIKGGAKWRRERFLSGFYHILCSIYVVFEREDRINQNKIIKFAKEYFRYDYSWIGCDINLLHYFIYNRLHFENATKVPEYSTTGTSLKNSIYAVEEFQQFKQQYEFSQHKIYETSMAVVWLIEKYF